MQRSYNNRGRVNPLQSTSIFNCPISQKYKLNFHANWIDEAKN
jgi:hypothetical protein